jgi:hypothetical protein
MKRMTARQRKNKKVRTDWPVEYSLTLGALPNLPSLSWYPNAFASIEN